MLYDRSLGKTGNFVSKNLIVSPGKAEGNTEIWGKQNELFPEGPVFKWFVISLEILKLEIH